MKIARARTRLRDIADRADVSVKTVFRALNEGTDVNPATKAKILRISRELGYQAKTYRTRARRQVVEGPSGAADAPTSRIGLVAVGSSLTCEANAFLLFQLTNAAMARSSRVEYLSTPQGLAPQELFARVHHFSEGLDGILLVDRVEPALVESLRRAGVALVVLGHLMTPDWRTAPADGATTVVG